MKSSINLEVFEKIICYNLITNKLYQSLVLESIDESHFSDDSLKVFIKYNKLFFNNFKKAPSLSEIKSFISDSDMEDFKSAVIKANSFKDNYDFDILVQNTERFIKERSVLNTMMKVIDDVTNKKLEPSKVYELFHKACNISLNINAGLDVFREIARIREEITKTNEYISTGLPWLDEKISGGFLKDGKALYVFVGPTNVGKSIFLGNMARNILKRNKTVVLITLEMSEIVYCKRIISSLTDIPMNSLKDSLDQMSNRLVNFSENNDKGKLIIKEFPTKAVTVHGIDNFLSNLVSKGIKPDAIVIDYLSIIKGDSPENMYADVKGISENLRAISYKYSAPVITASQVSRSKNAADAGAPDLSDVSQSMGIAETADCMFGIWKEDGDNELGVVHLGLMKSRQGENFGSCTLKIDYPTLTLSPMEEVFEGDNQSVKTAEDILEKITTNKLFT